MRQQASGSESWAPDSWEAFPALQQPVYPDAALLQRCLAELATLPPLVTSWEINALKGQLAQAQQGQAFLLQGGDCAESFDDCSSGPITNRLKVLLQMSLVLVHGMKKRVIRVGRFAGQYAKPRSADLEERDGLRLLSYRGDLVNRPTFTEAGRRPDPRLLLEAHTRSAMTLNFVRALVDGGFADLHHPEYWDLDWVGESALSSEYHRRANMIGDSIRFMEAIGRSSLGELSRVEFFTSHEALLLAYEQAVTRRVPRQEGWYNLSTHFPWIGLRTAHVDGAHVEYCRGIRNPIAVKVGSSIDDRWIQALCDRLNPLHEPGRLTLIHRFGAIGIAENLPRLIEAVRAGGHEVLWVCDPMHGNTRSTANGIKTRRFEDILSELGQAFEIHDQCGSRLGGVHLELTGENVTECTGGARNLGDADLSRAYTSRVDPRLNHDQALELAMKIAGHRDGFGLSN